MAKILVVEDDEHIRMALEDDLVLEGYEVDCAADGDEGLSRARHYEYELIILDLMLPKRNGLDVCRELRLEKNSTPILMLTAKSQEIDKVLGLELGADDYVTKPFSPRELLARIKAILRRTHQVKQETNVLRLGELEINFEKMEALRGDRPVYLTALEYSLLHFFAQHPNKVLHRDLILDQIWGQEVYVSPRTVDTHVANLRKKIEDNPGTPQYIQGVRGVGYKLILRDG